MRWERRDKKKRSKKGDEGVLWPTEKEVVS
jgi:hypothetical protein